MKFLYTSIVCLLLFSGCGNKTENNDNNQAEKTTTNIEQVKDNKEVKQDNIVLTDATGTNITVKKLEKGFIFEGYENKIVLLNFFATWCPPCKAEIPELNALQEKYKDDLKIISVLLEPNKSNEEVISFINDFNIKFTITNSPDNFKLADEVGGVESIPFMLIYDRNGTYKQHYTGAVPQEMVDADIVKVL